VERTHKVRYDLAIMRTPRRLRDRIVGVGSAVRRTYGATAERLESTIQLAQHRYTPLGRFTPTEFMGWRFLWWPALQGFAALTAILAGASFSDSPFKLEVAQTWFFSVPTQDSLVKPTPNETTLLFSIVLVFGGLVLLMRTWLRLAETLHHHPGAPLKNLYWMLALWTVPMLVVAPLFSRDVFSYAAQGEMTSHHISPYVNGPLTLGPSSPFFRGVDTLWQDTPAPYGPLFLFLDSMVVDIAQHNHLAAVAGLRILEVLAVALLAWALPKLARASNRDPGETLVLGALNPLVLLTLIGGIHNDALMAALLVTGIAFAMAKRPVLGLLFCSLATAIKAPAGLGLVYIAWTWPGFATWREKIRPFLIAGAIAAVVLGVTTLLAGFGLGWVRNLATPGTVRSWAAPATGIGLGLANVAHWVGWHVKTTHVITVTRVLGFVSAVAISLWLLWRAQDRGWVRSLAVSLLLFVILGPVVQPWYLVWGLMLLAASYVGREHFWLLLLSVVAPFLGLPGGRQLLGGLVHANPGEMLGFVVILVGSLLVPLGSWTQWSWPAPQEGDLIHQTN
jgi:hypothetical protein